jgi:hypothetical protein
MPIAYESMMYLLRNHIGVVRNRLGSASDHFAHTSLGPEIADSQLPEEAVNVFAESDVIHKSVPVKEPRA